MKLGVRAHDYGKHSPEKLAEILHREGLTSAQLAIPLAIEGVDSFADITDELLMEINTAFHKYGIEIAVLSCYIHPAHEDDKVRKGQVETYQCMLECSKKLGANMVGTERRRYNGTDADRTIHFERLGESVTAKVQKEEQLDA